MADVVDPVKRKHAQVKGPALEHRHRAGVAEHKAMARELLFYHLDHLGRDIEAHIIIAILGEQLGGSSRAHADIQDRAALNLRVQLIRERSALPLVDHGSFDLAVSRCRNIWASLPGAGYGQHENTIDKLKAAYLKAGGQFAESTTEAVVEAIEATPVKAPSVLTLIMAVLRFFANLGAKK